MKNLSLMRSYKILLVLSISILAQGCDKLGELSQPGAEKVLNSYLDASLKNRSEEAYKYISTEDKKIKPLAEYMRETKKSNNKLASALTKNVSFKILNVSESGNTAKADVAITLPDMGVLLKDFMAAALSSAFSGKDKSEIEKTIADKYDSGEIPLLTKNEEFHLLKEQDGWKVFLDLKTKQAKKLKEEKISSLLSDAKELRKADKLASAYKKYKEVLALNEEMAEAKEGIEEIKIELRKLKEKREYFEKVVLYDLKAEYYETYRDKNVPGVEFKLKNTGDRVLKEIQVTVYFKDSKGQVIAEKDYHPVLVSKYSFGRNNKPLKPNYIWQMERGKFYKADSVPTEWKEGSVEAKISDIEFSKQI